MLLLFHNSIHKDKGMVITITINISQEKTLAETIIFYQKALIQTFKLFEFPTCSMVLLRFYML